VIANVVDDRQAFFAFCFPQSSPELLQPKDFRLGRAEHHDGIDQREVDALVEHVDGKHNLELAYLKLFQRESSRR
jgi:hypothetical protein